MDTEDIRGGFDKVRRKCKLFRAIQQKCGGALLCSCSGGVLRSFLDDTPPTAMVRRAGPYDTQFMCSTPDRHTIEGFDRRSAALADTFVTHINFQARAAAGAEFDFMGALGGQLIYSGLDSQGKANNEVG